MHVWEACLQFQKKQGQQRNWAVGRKQLLWPENCWKLNKDSICFVCVVNPALHVGEVHVLVRCPCKMSKSVVECLDSFHLANAAAGILSCALRMHCGNLSQVLDVFIVAWKGRLSVSEASICIPWAYCKITSALAISYFCVGWKGLHCTACPTTASSTCTKSVLPHCSGQFHPCLCLHIFV